MSEKITFVTGNSSKAEQLGWHLGIEVDHHDLDLDEIQSLNLEEIIRHKAEEAYQVIGSPILVEDAALQCNALGKLPGPLIKWFFQEIGADGLCELLNGYEDRSAIVSNMFGYYDGIEFKSFYGEMRGNIAESPRLESGFPADTIFIPDGYTETWSQMSEELQKETSVRRIALRALEAELG